MRKDLYLDIDLTLEPRYTKEFIVKKQDSVNLFITLKNENIPVIVEGQIPRLYVRKQDGTVVVQGGTEELGDGSIVLSGNTAMIKLKNSAINAVGLCYAELELEDAEGITITQSFLFEVVDRLADTDTPIKAVNDIYLLAEVEKFIIQAKKDLEEIRTSITVLQGNMNSAIADFNAKVEATVSKIATSETSALQSIETKRVESISSIDTKTQTSITEIEASKTGAMQEVSGTKDSLLNEMATAKTQHIAELDEKTLKSMQELQIVGNTKINQMDEEHTAFKQTVSNAEVIKIALTELNALAELTKTDLSNVNNTGQGIVIELNRIIESANSIKALIEAENTEANANITELKPLNLEADANIEELKALIQEAKDIAIPALKAYIAEHTPAGDLTEVNERLEALTNAINETYSILINHHHDSVYGASKKQGFFGDSIYMFPIHTTCAGHTPSEAFGEYKSCIRFSIFRSTNVEYYSIFFKEDLNDPASKVYVSLENNVLKINGGTFGVDFYTCYNGGTTGNTIFAFIGTTKLYALDFPLYNNARDTIVLQNPLNSGLGDFNEAKTSGYYTIDLPLDKFQKIANSPAVIANKAIKGILEVKTVGSNILQTLKLHSINQEFQRLVGEPWKRIDGGIYKENIMTIGIASGVAVPEALNSLPQNPYFWDNTSGYVIFQSGANEFYAIYTYGTPLKAFYAGSTSIYINCAKDKLYGFRFSPSTLAWKEELSSVSSTTLGSITVTKAYFKILACSSPVYTSSAYTDIYQDITALDYNVLPTVTDFRAVDKTGLYYVDINAGDDIANAPYSTTETLYVANTEEELQYDLNEDGLLEEADLLGMPATLESEIHTYSTMQRGITDRDIKGYCDVVVKDNGEKYLTFYENNGDVLKMSYNGIDWTEWCPISGMDIEDYYNKAEINSLVSGVYKVGNKYSESDYALLTRDEYKYINPAWSVIPETTFINMPAKPDDTYKWYMKCTHYNYHMIFYFNTDPTGKFGVFKDSTGEHFKLLDSSFTYSTYKGYYKAQSTGTTWTAFSNDNHFTATPRLLNNMYEHNFNIVDANDPTKIYYQGVDSSVPVIKVDFNECIEYKKYKVKQDSTNVLLNSPLDTSYTGILEVEKTDNYIKQVLITNETGTKAYRTYNGTSWSEWSFEAKVEYGEHIMEATVLLNEVDEGQIFDIMPFGTFKDTDKYYVRISPKQKFSKVTGVTVHSDLADLIIGFELTINAIMINGSNDFFIFVKNNFKDTTGGYTAYEGLGKLTGRALRYSIVGY